MTSQAMTHDAPVDVVRGFIDTWNKHDTSATMAQLDPDVVFQSPLFHVKGVAARTTTTAWT